jgi:hypothetical protein
MALASLSETTEIVSTRSLITDRRWDLAVKWRFFKHLIHGGDPDSDRVYRWHIEKRSGRRMRAGVPTDKWKRSLDDYVASAGSLAGSMGMQGFLPEFAIPVDPAGELLGGAHRLACSLALGLETVRVERSVNRVWAPAWNEAWFIENGMNAADLERLRKDWQELNGLSHNC